MQKKSTVVSGVRAQCLDCIVRLCAQIRGVQTSNTEFTVGASRFPRTFVRTPPKHFTIVKPAQHTLSQTEDFVTKYTYFCFHFQRFLKYQWGCHVSYQVLQERAVCGQLLMPSYICCFYSEWTYSLRFFSELWIDMYTRVYIRTPIFSIHVNFKFDAWQIN